MAGEPAIGFPFLDHLRVHAFAPIGIGQAIVRDGKFGVVMQVLSAQAQTYTDLHDFNGSAGDPYNFQLTKLARRTRSTAVNHVEIYQP